MSAVWWTGSDAMTPSYPRTSCTLSRVCGAIFKGSAVPPAESRPAIPSKGRPEPRRRSLRLLMHAVLHVVAPFEKVDGRVFLLGLGLALGLKLGHSWAFFLGGGIGRHGKRAGQQAGRNDGEYGFHGSSSSRRKTNAPGRTRVPK